MPGVRRRIHHSSRNQQQASLDKSLYPQDLANITPDQPRNISTREYLKQWQQKFGRPDQELLDELGIDIFTGSGANDDNLSRLSNPYDLRDASRNETDAEDYAHAMSSTDEESLLDEGWHGRYLLPGDLVELGFKNEREPHIAVFVRQFKSQGQFYASNGMWFHRREKDIQFCIPGFLDPALLDSIMPYLPSSELTDELLDTMQMMDVNAPRGLGAPIINKLTDFTEKVDASYRKNASILESAHEKLAHPTDLRFGSLRKITETLLQVKNPEETTMYAVRRALLHQPLGFYTDSRSHRMTSAFQIMPTELVQRMDTAQRWIREYQEDLARHSSRLDDGHADGPEKKSGGAVTVETFISKARQLIDQSRTMREPTVSGRVAPSKDRTEITPESNAMREIVSTKFSESDGILIRFMESWCVSGLFKDAPRVNSLPPALLRAVGKYDGYELDRAVGFLFLQEIGVIPPHENKGKFDPHLLLPTAQHSRQLEQMYLSLVKMGSGRKMRVYVDSMRRMRKDWGDLPVYCVDMASAEEIDDGLSIEHIPGTDEYWVHVHVANPTAFLHKDNIVSKMAAHLTETIYMPERTYSMLPKWLVDEKFSLAPMRPCLTISTRLNDKGETLDIKIESGFIRKVVSITPQTLEEVVYEGKEVEKSAAEHTVIVGGKVPPVQARKMKKLHELGEREKNDIKALHELALARQRIRQQAGGIFFNQGYPEMSVFNNYTRPGLPWSNPSRDQARFTIGDPVIQMQATSKESWFQAAGSGSALMVQEMMLLAGEVGALWCRQRNIPIMYRGTIRRPGYMTAEEYEENVMKPSLDQNGNPPTRIALEYLAYAGSSMTTTEPRKHQVLGTPQYTKITSPLRRYGDMLLHWQIESALRKEAELGHSLVDYDGPQNYLTFSMLEVEQIMQRLAPRERLISKTKRAAQAFWMSQLLFRAFYYKEAQLPDTLEVIIFNVLKEKVDRITVFWPDYSYDMEMMLPAEVGIEDEVRVGDRWEVRFSSINTFISRAYVEPIRLIKRDE